MSYKIVEVVTGRAAGFSEIRGECQNWEDDSLPKPAKSPDDAEAPAVSYNS